MGRPRSLPPFPSYLNYSCDGAGKLKSGGVRRLVESLLPEKTDARMPPRPKASGKHTIDWGRLSLGGFAMHRIGLTSCPYCGSSEIYASERRTLWQRISIVFLLRLVRCHACMRRHYRPIIYPPTTPALRGGLRKKSHTASSENSVKKDRSA